MLMSICPIAAVGSSLSEAPLVLQSCFELMACTIDSEVAFRKRADDLGVSAAVYTALQARKWH
eukprot:6388026-Amphidinium_carterae.1